MDTWKIDVQKITVIVMVTVYKARLHIGCKSFADGYLHWAAGGLCPLQALGLDSVYHYRHNLSETIRWEMCFSNLGLE